jgi:hypothetical protein
LALGPWCSRELVSHSAEDLALENKQVGQLVALCQRIVRDELHLTERLPTLSRDKRGDHMVCDRIDGSEIVTAVSQSLPIDTITSNGHGRIDFACTIWL